MDLEKMDPMMTVEEIQEQHETRKRIIEEKMMRLESYLESLEMTNKELISDSKDVIITLKMYEKYSELILQRLEKALKRSTDSTERNDTISKLHNSEFASVTCYQDGSFEKFGQLYTIKRSLYNELYSTKKNDREWRMTVGSIERILRQLEAMGENLEQSSIETIIESRLPAWILEKIYQQGTGIMVYSTVKQRTERLKELKVCLNCFDNSTRRRIVKAENVPAFTAKALTTQHYANRGYDEPNKEEAKKVNVINPVNQEIQSGAIALFDTGAQTSNKYPTSSPYYTTVIGVKTTDSQTIFLKVNVREYSTNSLPVIPLDQRDLPNIMPTSVWPQRTSTTVSINSITDIDRFWILEVIGIQDKPDDEDNEQALNQFKDSITEINRRYQVSWQWKETNLKLNDNFGLCLSRLQSLIRRLQNDKDLSRKYSETINERLRSNVIEEVNNETNQDGIIHYLPHQEVVTPNKSTTKLRIVYDASAHLKGMKSLNDVLYRGPITLSDLAGVLLRFRAMKNVLIADIEKAFYIWSCYQRKGIVQDFYDEASMNIKEFFSNDKSFNAQLPNCDLAENNFTVIASHFDPLGFLVPTMISFKLFLQDLWEKKLPWDQPLNEHESQTWNSLITLWPTYVKEIPRAVISSDSRCALHWIQNYSRLLPRFIQNRVEEIRKAKYAYRFIPSECNPADIATKGISPSDLANLTLWWNGPEWLKEEESNWPQWEYDIKQESDNEETIDEEGEQVVVTAIQEAITKTSIRFVDANRFSNWSRMVRTTGIQITPYEYEFAVELLLRQAQSEGLSVEEIKKRNLADCNFQAVVVLYLIITEIIIQTYHEKIHHDGILHTISELRRLYWIPKGRAEVKRVLNKCYGCKRWKAKSFKLPRMPDYHASRNRIFARIALNYLGPVTAKTEVGIPKDGYITPKAPWSGGIYERMVGITKGAFRKAKDEYLNSLRERTQIEHKSPRGAITRPPSLGEVVLECSDRIALGKLLNRLVNMLYPLEVEQEDQPEVSVTELMDAKDEEPITRRTRSSTKELRTPAVI
ncbi:Pao retrotransposon peptidase family protein [Dirofilaria immitis]|nr:Pao retrotransposon peptidase family protein [Dirofilaria immitis]